MKYISINLSFVAYFYAAFVNLVWSHVPDPDLTTQATWQKGHAAKITADHCPPGWEYFDETTKCFKAFSGPLTHKESEEYCSRQGGSLATVSDAELDFVIRRNWQVTSPYWMGYIIQRESNSSHWDLTSDDGTIRSEGSDPPKIAMPTVIPTNLADSSQLCVAINIQSVVIFFLWQFEVHPCDTQQAFLCVRTPTQPCIDMKGNVVGEGESYKPRNYGPCMQCKCQNGERSMCVQSQCAQPRCRNYVDDPDVCCTYHCLDDDGNSVPSGIDVTDNMRWVLTMLTSFILLGMMLFMVYRMRQKRMAYLRYRAQQLREGNMMDFEAGSGPPPPPNIDDIDANGYREPPPPYSFLKVDLPLDCPPPYEPTPAPFQLTQQPLGDVNRNHDSRSSTEGEEMALLAAGTSEPTTPVDKQEQGEPPSYTPSSPYITNSDDRSPDTERSIISNAETEDQETLDTPSTPSSPVTLLPSINTTV